jgi:signal transduction histidine kinase
MQFEGSTYRTIFEWLPTPAVLLDEQLRVMLANRAASSTFGLPPDKLAGLSILSLIPHQTLADSLLNFGPAPSKTLEIQPPTRAGQPPSTLKITAVQLGVRAALPNSSTTTRRTGTRDLRLLLIENVTDKIMLEEQLVHAEKVAGMGQLAAGIAHELANPLTSMASNLLFVRDSLASSTPGEVWEALDTTVEKLNDLQQLLSTISNFARRQERKYEVVDLNQVIRRSATFITRDAERRRIHLVVSLAPFIINCYIDRRLMNQVLLNLFKNAMEAMPRGGRLEIKTQQLPGNEDSGLAIVEVSDTGMGIAEIELQKIFRPLYSTKPQGMGLGLPFCRRVIEEHAGEIKIASQMGLGTTVTLKLPVHQEGTGRIRDSHEGPNRIPRDFDH